MEGERAPVRMSLHVRRISLARGSLALFCRQIAFLLLDHLSVCEMRARAIPVAEIIASAVR